MNVHSPKPRAARYRTIWISDFHLGTRRVQAELLLDFLRATESDTLYLVGDIVDNWALRKTWQWDQLHNDVIQKLLRKARKGTRVIYIPGNHDENFRDFAGTRFGRMAVRLSDIHISATGKRYARRNFMVPIPRFASFADLNEHLADQCHKRQQAVLRGHKRSIGERFENDANALAALPRYPYQACDTQATRVPIVSKRSQSISSECDFSSSIRIRSLDCSRPSGRTVNGLLVGSLSVHIELKVGNVVIMIGIIPHCTCDMLLFDQLLECRVLDYLG